jgi:DNA (cytosine-5)-methyltransferase 3A
MNVLSLFDGISCGRLALQRSNVQITNYYASEINKHAINVSKYNFPEIIHVGSVINLDISKLPKIDLLIGGSPCQSFSLIGKRNGMTTKENIKVTNLNQYLELKKQNFKFEGESYLFWEYVRIYEELKPKYFLLENVIMSKEWENVISETLNVKPIMINSSLVSAQNRKRLYWTNIGSYINQIFNNYETIIQQPKDKLIYLKDILQKNVDDKYFIENEKVKKLIERTEKNKKNKLGYRFNVLSKDSVLKTNILTANSNLFNNLQSSFIYVGDYRSDEGYRWKKTNYKCVTLLSYANVLLKNNENLIRILTPIEYERLQTLPDNYTFTISDNQRYKCVGNGWTIDVIAHIFSYIK